MAAKKSAGAGERTELVTFERETRVRRAGGGFDGEWTPLGQAWAAVTWLSGGEKLSQGAVRANEKYRFTVPSASLDELGVTTADRIIWNSTPFHIVERPRALPALPVSEIVAVVVQGA